MTKSETVYTTLCVLFSVILVLGNLIYQKFVSINILYLTSIELSVGAILYPITFLITDLITEFYGKQKARFCIRMAIGMNIIVALAITGIDSLETTPWSKVDGETFHNVFGLYSVAFIGSIIACYISQRVDVFTYWSIRQRTGDKWLWLRNNVSTAISLLIDTSIVISFLSIFGVIPAERAGPLIINSYLFKFIFVICSTPFFYLAYWTIRQVFKIHAMQLSKSPAI